MKKSGLLAAIFVFSSIAFAQKTPSSSSAGGNGSGGRKVGNVVVPPEKLRPITIPKTTLPIVIDGRPDEEAWKTAAVFNDFYQTSPGRNITPSEPPAAPKLDPGKGWQFDANLGFEYKPVDPFRISLDYTKSNLTRNDNHKIAYDTNIFTLRSTYQFTRFVFVRARCDYDTLKANVSGQMLFGLTPNPGTAFYVGYNDNFNDNGFSQLTVQFEPRFERNNWTFFIRASYRFRKSF